jgi:hypothetical protein
MKQGTPEWHLARLGKFTSSRLSDLLVSGRKKEEMFGQTAMSYIYEVAAERNISQAYRKGEGLEALIDRMNVTSKSMKWGTEMESWAREVYEDETGLNVEEPGFIEYNDYFGDSPDGIVRDSESSTGTIEIKCPSPAAHLTYCRIKNQEGLIQTKKEYYIQCQGHIIANRTAWCDFVSFDPMQVKRIHIVRVLPDGEMIKTILSRIYEANLIIESINSEIFA